jgi:hypothetical protein
MKVSIAAVFGLFAAANAIELVRTAFLVRMLHGIDVIWSFAVDLNWHSLTLPF